MAWQGRRGEGWAERRVRAGFPGGHCTKQRSEALYREHGDLLQRPPRGGGEWGGRGRRVGRPPQVLGWAGCRGVKEAEVGEWMSLPPPQGAVPASS